MSVYEILRKVRYVSATVALVYIEREREKGKKRKRKCAASKSPRRFNGRAEKLLKEGKSGKYRLTESPHLASKNIDCNGTNIQEDIVRI